MSQPREVGEPVVKVEKVETILPDGRKVIKTIKKITKSYQVEVPAGTPLPEGARIVSTSAAEVPADNTVVTHYQTSSTSSSDSDTLQRPEDLQHLGGQVASEPTVVVQTTVDENGRKVTKTTTTTSSSNAGGPLSKLFKRFSLNSGKKEKKSDSKPLPSIPPQQAKAQVVKSESKPAASEPAPVIANLAVQTLEYKRPDGKKVALSDCTGDRRAVLIGINYVGGANPLNGCVNDTAVMKAFLLEKGFKEENIRVLTDAGQHNAKLMPTRDNILHNLKWLVHDPKKNDSYFLHYSGHGGQTLDLDGDETGGKDNCLFPLDYVEKGVIIDDELHNLLVKTLPPGVRLTVLFDCCHSGSAMDLPYIYASTGYIRGSSALANLGHELVEGDFDEDTLKELKEKWKQLQAEEKEFSRQVSLKAADADVIMFSGCKDDQTSADVKVTRSGGKSESNGAMTYAFTKCVRENSMQSYQEMLVNIRELLREKYKQKPQLSSSRPMNMAELFHM